MSVRFAHPDDFRRLWLGQTVSAFGDKISRIALPTVALLDLHGTAWDVGLLAAARFLPFVLIGAVAGVWVDRVSRRRTMILADVGRMVATASVPLAAVLGGLTMAHLFAVAGVVGVLTVFFEVAAQSYMPVLAGPEGITAGNERLQSSRGAAEVGGSAAAGGLMDLLGNALAVLVDALSFVASLVTLLLIRHREPLVEKVSTRGAVREGWRVLLADGRLRNLMFATAVVNLGLATGGAIVLVFAYRDRGLGPGAVGVAAALGTIGFIAGAVSARTIARWIELGRTLALAIVVTGLGFVLPVLGESAVALPMLIAGQFVFGFAGSVFNVHVLSLVQRITPAAMLGRVNGTALSVVWGTGTVGGLVGGVVGSAVGGAAGLVVAGGIVCCGALFVVFGPLRTVQPEPSGAPASRL
ncbi:MFS transporter [Actinokineospora enzanensis]|uniref:MFS transporter n=1 Tax=Actinokineospora enzanensis TaxID=155975 RepID=UPI00036E0FAF|nr:MFS transporter [Actinokineospora enzanensis]